MWMNDPARPVRRGRTRLNCGLSRLPFIARTGRMGPWVLHILAECGALKGEGPEGPPREHRASGVLCRTRRHLRAEAEGKLVSLWARMPLGPTATSLYGGKLIMTAGLGPGPGSGGSESGCH